MKTVDTKRLVKAIKEEIRYPYADGEGNGVISSMKKGVARWAWNGYVRNVVNMLDEDWEDEEMLATWICNDHVFFRNETTFPKVLIPLAVEEAMNVSKFPRSKS